MFLRRPEVHHSIIITFKQLCNLFSSQKCLYFRERKCSSDNFVCSILSGVKRDKLDHWIKFKKLTLLFIIKLIKSDSKVIYDITISISVSWVTEELSNGCWEFSFAITGINFILKYTKIEKYKLLLHIIHIFISQMDICVTPTDSLWPTVDPKFRKKKNKCKLTDE